MSGRILVGGLGYRFQRDASFGLHVSDALEVSALPEGVQVADLGYGAIYAAQDLAAADPPWQRVILVASVVRGRPPGLYDRRPDPALPHADEIQARIREAGAGVIDLDHLLVVGRYFDAFPPDLRLLELEPVDTGGGEGLSVEAARLLPVAVERVLAATGEPLTAAVTT